MLTEEGMGECFAEIGKAMDAEVRMTKLLRDNDYEVDAFLSNYHSQDKEAKYARMRARMQAGHDLAKREEIQVTAAPTAGTGDNSINPAEEPQGDWHPPSDACEYIEFKLEVLEHWDLPDETKNGIVDELYSYCEEQHTTEGDVAAEKLARWKSVRVSEAAGDGKETGARISPAVVEGRDTRPKMHLRKLFERSGTVSEWMKEEMWGKMRKEIMAGHGKVKREAGQMGDVTEAQKPEVSAAEQPKYEYEIRPTREEEEAMVKAYHLRENPKAEQWHPNPVERFPLFPRDKRSRFSMAEEQGKAKRFEPLPPRPESAETKRYPLPPPSASSSSNF